MPDHFHLSVKVDAGEQADENINNVVSNQFKKMFIAYSNAVNKTHKMHGGIFETPFRRILVDDDKYFSSIIYCIHCNPLHHNLTVDISNYAYSSYKDFLVDKPTLLQRDKVFQWFGGKNAFLKYHQTQKRIICRMSF